MPRSVFYHDVMVVRVIMYYAASSNDTHHAGHSTPAARCICPEHYIIGE